LDSVVATSDEPSKAVKVSSSSPAEPQPTESHNVV
jgi:hypothetical protein